MYEEWYNLEYQNRFTFDLVDPSTMNFLRGRMDNVILNQSSYSQGYESSTRIAADIRLMDTSQYIANSLVRIRHHVDEKNYENVIGTFYVTGFNEEYERGRWVGNFYLDSILKGIEFDFLISHYSIAVGKYTNDVFADIFKRVNRKYMIMPGVKNVRFSAAKVYEYGTNYLTFLFELCEMCDARLNVDNMGIVIIEPILDPAKIVPDFNFDYDANPNMIIGSVRRISNQFDMPGCVSIMSKNSDAQVIGVANAAASSIASPATRGYRKTLIKNYTDLAPFTVAQANRVSNDLLAKELTKTLEFEFRSYYVPLSQGDVVTLKIDGEVHKCLVKTLEIELSGMIMQVYLRKIG